MPPLRERGRDVLLLGGFFLEENRSRLGLGGLRLDAGAQAALLAHGWPGNVRELEHLLGRSVLKALGRQPNRPRILSLTAEDLDLPKGDAEPSVPPVEGHAPVTTAQDLSLREAVAQLERRLVTDTLARHGFNRAAAARALGLDRANLARLVKRLGVAELPDNARGTGWRGAKRPSAPQRSSR